MEKKRLVTIATTAAIALTLAGCGAKQAANSTGSRSETSLLAKKSATKISANNLAPQKTVSLVTVYAGNKFGGAWAKTAKAAKKNGLVTDLESTNGYKLSGKNQGVAYHVHANNQQSKLVYTVNGNKVSIYQNAQKSSSKKLATVSRHQMVNFINDNGQGQLVNQLASQAQINDQRGSSSSASSTNASVGKYGNQGTVNVPTAMQGTWYSAEYGDSSITFGAHTLAVHGDGEGSQLTLYRQDPHADFDMDDHSIQNATKSWGSDHL